MKKRKRNLSDDVLALLPSALVEDRRLTDNALAVLEVLLTQSRSTFVNEDGSFYVSNKTLKKKAEIKHDMSLSRAISQLINHGLVSRTPGVKEGTASTYRLNFDAIEGTNKGTNKGTNTNDVIMLNVNDLRSVITGIIDEYFSNIANLLKIKGTNSSDESEVLALYYTSLYNTTSDLIKKSIKNSSLSFSLESSVLLGDVTEEKNKTKKFINSSEKGNTADADTCGSGSTTSANGESQTENNTQSEIQNFMDNYDYQSYYSPGANVTEEDMDEAFNEYINEMATRETPTEGTNNTQTDFQTESDLRSLTRELINRAYQSRDNNEATALLQQAREAIDRISDTNLREKRMAWAEKVQGYVNDRISREATQTIKFNPDSYEIPQTDEQLSYEDVMMSGRAYEDLAYLWRSTDKRCYEDMSERASRKIARLQNQQLREIFQNWYDAILNGKAKLEQKRSEQQRRQQTGDFNHQEEAPRNQHATSGSAPKSQTTVEAEKPAAAVERETIIEWARKGQEAENSCDYVLYTKLLEDTTKAIGQYHKDDAELIRECSRLFNTSIRA